MKFEIINNNEGDLSHKGYKFAENSERMFDEKLSIKLSRQISENFVYTLFDDFYDGFDPICEGEDGKTYMVLFVYEDFGDFEKKPFIWQEVERI